MASKKNKETKYTEELNKYFHLSNSGLSAILYKTEDGTKYPHTKIHLQTGTFGVMNTTLELIGSNHTERFMSVKDMLELSAFFAEAAKVTNEIEIKSTEQYIQHWKDIIQKNKDPYEGKSVRPADDIKKHWNKLELLAKAKLNKVSLEKERLIVLNDTIQKEVQSFNSFFYPEPKKGDDTEECITEE